MHSRAKVLHSAIEVAVEDFVKSGMNVCIGGGRLEDVTRLVDVLSSRTDAGGLVDIAFVSASPSTRTLLTERELPSDLSVNFKQRIDLFIAPVVAMDVDCNAVLDSDDIAADKCAALASDQIILIVLEDDLEHSRSGILSVPAKVVDFLPEINSEMLCSATLIDLGVRGATLRTDASLVADLSIAPGTFLPAFEHEMQRSPQVIASGLLLSSKKTTAVVATNDLEPYDLTAALHSIASLDDESRTKALPSAKRNELTRMYVKGWMRKERELDEALSKEFDFTSYERAAAFVRYAQFASTQARHYAEISHACTKVTLSVTTKGAKGITELDIMVAKDLSSAYNRMTAPESMAFISD